VTSKSILVVGDGPVPHDYMNYRADVLVRYLALRTKHTVEILCPSPTQRRSDLDLAEGYPDVRFSYLPSSDPVSGFVSAVRRMVTVGSTVAHIRRILNSGRVDCIRTISSAPTVAAVLARGRRQIPIVANLSDFYGDLYTGSRLPLAWIAVHLIAIVERLCSRADVVIVDSPFQRARWGKRGVVQDRCVVLPHGLPRTAPAVVGPSPGCLTDLRLSLKLAPDEKLAVHLGDVGEMDGVDILVGALGALRREGVPVSLLVIGDGTPRYMRELEKIVERCGLRQNYFQIREVRNDELPLLLSQCDVCVAPFRLRDTSMTAIQNKVLEYLTVDVPIVATRSEALEWALGDAVCLVDPENEKALASAVWDAIKDSTMSRHQMKRRNAIRQSLEWADLLLTEIAIIEGVFCETTPRWNQWDFEPSWAV
jgi:glycosyltransferase involved in cell wall biosynthesis